MTNSKETLLGSTKYDGKIRRITLIKTVADLLKMQDGDEVYYYYDGKDVIIRKEQQIHLEFSPLFKAISEDSVRRIMGRFCDAGDVSGYGRDLNWSKLPKDRMEDEFIKTTDSMSKDERLRLMNAMILELANRK